MSDVIPFAPRHAAPVPRGGASWSWPMRVLFRCSLPYMVLTSLLWVFEFADKLTSLMARLFLASWRPMVLWMAVHVFGWHDAIALNFVRDTRYLYALLSCFLVFSIVAGIVWSVLDRKRVEYGSLHDWLRAMLRYGLVYLLLHYGMDKVFLLQFPAPSFARLTERVGDYSPSSLMWTFIGSSAAYTVFGGLAEILGAVLLLFRRTTTLGALIAFAVMFNVTVMDFSYDVAVKLLCLHILLMAVYLVLPDVGRLLQFFVFNRATRPVEVAAYSTDRRKRLATMALKIVVVVYLFGSLTIRDWHTYKLSGAGAPGAPRPPLYGLYEVEEFRVDGVVHPPLVTDAERWRYVMIENAGKLSVRRMDESLTEYGMAYDAGSHEMHLAMSGPVPESGGVTIFKVTELGQGLLQIEGNWGNVPMSLKLKAIDRNSFTLVSRGFHWISETSFIR
jgi:uncharacterized membrane protein YphA (DoxX/SURF4 family)